MDSEVRPVWWFFSREPRKLL